MNLLSCAFGVLMVLSAAGTGGPTTLAVLGLAAVAVLVGLIERRAAPVAVTLTVVALGMADPTPLFAAVSGLCAAAYLVTRYGAGTGAVTLTVPTVAGMLGFAVAGLAATAVTLPVSGIALLAPPLMAALLIAVVRMTDARSDP